MNKRENDKKTFEGKSDYQSRKSYYNFSKMYQPIEDQPFVVPWQMTNSEEESVLVK